MSSNSILKVNVFQPELQENITDDTFINYDITFLKKSSNSFSNSKIEGKLKSTNYYVPLDYNGTFFCWVQYQNDKQDRIICVQNVSTEGIFRKFHTFRR